MCDERPQGHGITLPDLLEPFGLVSRLLLIGMREGAEPLLLAFGVMLAVLFTSTGAIGSG